MHTTGGHRVMIYGALIRMADKLSSENSERTRGIWTKLGKIAIEIDRPADLVNDRAQRSRIRRDQ